MVRRLLAPQTPRLSQIPGQNGNLATRYWVLHTCASLSAAKQQEIKNKNMVESSGVNFIDF